MLALLTLLIAACTSGFPTGPSDDDDSTPPVIVFDDDDDDATGDDDDIADDDDTTPPPDDDDNTPNYEGDEPGECSDGADNDQDGAFDCDDSDCFGAPDCIGDDDDSTPVPDDDDTTPVPDDDDSTPVPDDDDTTPPPDDDDAIDTFEGDEVGECEDGVDNDNDFLIDCDDPTCNVDPACGGPDDDDTTPPPDGTPLITNLVATWNASALEFQFDIGVIDGDCDLGNPTLGWTFNGSPRPPVTLGGPAVTCNANITFWVQGITPGLTYQFTFTVTDSAGNTSASWPITITAS